MFFCVDLRGRSDGAKSAELHSNQGTVYNKLPSCNTKQIIAVRKVRKPCRFHGCVSQAALRHFLQTFFSNLVMQKNVFNYQLTGKFVCMCHA
jgi:hypothetical protein